MKLQKVALILGLTVCVAGTQVQMTFGSEQTEITDQQDSEENVKPDEEQDSEAEDSEEVENSEQDGQNEESSDGLTDKENDPTTEDMNGEGNEAQKPESGENPDGNTGGTTGDNTDSEKPEEGEKPDGSTGDNTDPGKPDEGEKPDGSTGDNTDPEKPEEGEKPDGSTGDNTDPEKPEEGEKPDGSTGDNTDPEKPEEGEKPDGSTGDNTHPEKPEEEEKPDTETSDNEETGGSDSNKEQITPPKEEQPVPDTPADSGTEENGNYSESTYSENIYNSYSASIKFLDDSEKIKYNVSVPIVGLPSFITQEMIVAALKCQDETGYPASVTIAQIIQESGFGNYGPGGEDGKGLSYLAYQYNNLFGIKGTGPAGSVDMITGEQSKDGSMFTIVSGFRVYDTYTECIEDRTELLKEVYADLTFGVEDANTFAMKIGSRWATSLTYGQSLIRQMEEYDLYRLDNMTLGEFSNLLGTFVNPCPGAVLSSNFGLRDEPIAGAGNGHNGIDLGTGTYNIPTYAAAAGTVTFAGEAGTAGNLIIIDHGKGLITKYMHHEKLFVEEGQKVEKGQQIGLSGTTGMSTGNHLHFQVEKNGTPVDPMQFFTEKQQESFYK